MEKGIQGKGCDPKMKRTGRIILLAVILIAAVTGALLFWYSHRYTPIDRWSGNLVPEKISWAQVSREYGIAKDSYVLAEEEYAELLSMLRTVTEAVSSRKEKAKRLEAGYRLEFFYEGTLWLFKCCENGIVSLTFDSAETGAIYGCEGSLLYINSPDLWTYVVNTVDEKTVQ